MNASPDNLRINMHRHRPHIYYPQSVFLPAGIQREILVPSNDGKAGSPLTEEGKAQYDYKTLFYDIFLVADRRTLICLGPPFVNIGPPLAVTYKGQNLKFTVTRREREWGLHYILCSVVYIALGTIRWRGSLSLTMGFADFDIDISVAFSAHKLIDRKEEILLTALQKDNPLIWIKDWCQWYGRVHGLRRIIIYDNGSSIEYSLTDLRAELTMTDVEVLLVHWPFPFGPKDSSSNQFTHIGQLNHARLFWGDRVRWCINLDIDEYLYVNPPWTLRDYQRRRSSHSIVYLDSYHAFIPQEVERDRLPRFFDHTIRFLDMRRWSGKKYIYQPQRIRYNYIHNALSYFPSLARWRQGIMGIWERSSFSLLLRKRRREPALFFYHFYNLNIGWKYPRRAWSFRHKDYKHSRLVKEERIFQLARKIGLATPPSPAAHKKS